MPEHTRLRFESTIHAPQAVVWHHVTTRESYERWTSAFIEGSTFEGAWNTGSPIRFVGPDGAGLVAEIAESRPHAFISIRQLGVVAGGVVDTTSDAVRAWAPAYENYSFHAVPEGTRMVVDQDMAPEYEAFMAEAWPKALALLKALCEAPQPR